VNETPLTLSFDALKSGQLGVTTVYGSFLAEAASHCLRRNGHANPVLMHITGDLRTTGSLTLDDADERDDGTWADLQEATEYGAYGVAIIVALPLTDMPRVERSAKGPGVDYWVGDGKDERGIFQRAARLEVSGILKGDEAKIAARLKQKLTQTERSDKTGLPAYVMIVEFGSPESRFVKSSTETKP
jgi:hypothetical protein